MLQFFKRSFFLFFIFFSIGLFSFPSLTLAQGLIPCGKNSGTAAEQAPCTVCHVIVAGNGLITWGLGIMTTIAVTVIFAMAVYYVISAGDEGMMQTAKAGIKASLIGFAVMLSAWLIVNIVISVLADTTNPNSPLNGLVQGDRFTFSCNTTSNVRR